MDQDISDLPIPQAPDISDLPAPPPAARPGHAAPVTDQNPLEYAAKSIVGGAETALAGISGGAGSLADAVTGSDPGTHDWAYRPRTAAGQAISSGLGQVVGAANQKIAQAGGAVVGTLGGNQQAAEDTLNERLPEAEGAVSTVIPLVKGAGGLTDAAVKLYNKPRTPPEITSAAQAAANQTAASGNAGAAATAVDVTKLNPETQAELARIGASNGTVNPTALSRVSEAESLPVPVRLTAGQARGDADLISQEFNMKGEDNNAIGARYDEQDQALKDNIAKLHQQAAPDTVANNPIQNGQAIVDSLKRYDQPKVAAINAAYQAAKDANGGDLQMDGTGFAAQADAALKPQGRARFLPASIQGIIDDVKANDGKMSLDDFEGYRTAMANEVRKAQQSGDGNAVAAINQVRDALEATPTVGATAAAKALYDNARNMAKARFAELDADPAYNAAVSDDTAIGEQSDLADKFTDKYVLGGSKAALQRLRPKLDAEGQQAMTSSAMNYLQGRAGINPDTGAGKFSNAGYNAALTKIMPKASELLADPPDLIDNVRKVGNVANYTQALSRGAYANTSHTFVAAKAAEIGEHAVNTAAHGLPVGTIARKYLEARSSRAAARAAIKPGAGLED